jgi:cell division septation protein DedD
MRTAEHDSMAEGQSTDTEITLGVGKLLVLFFALVILCGISLSVGYSLGRNSTKQAAQTAPATTGSATPITPGVAKPGAAQSTSAASTPKVDDSVQSAAASPSSSTDFTFSRSLQEKDEHPKLAQPPAPTPTPTIDTHATLGTGYMVQIAAVRNQDDAKLLSAALQKQHFPVIVAQLADKLYHVQVGPYADVKEAETIRAKLIGIGYNAFLKR